MSVKELIQILAGFVGSFGFACLFNIRGRRLLVASLGGLLAVFLCFAKQGTRKQLGR